MSEAKQIFIVDDDPLVCNATEALVTTIGHRARSFHSAEDFLADTDRSVRGCLVADLHLPGMSGLDLLSRISRSRPFVATLIITGFARTPVTVQAVRCGALSVLDKPVQADQLRQEIARALQVVDQRHQRHARIVDLRSRMAKLTDDEQKVLEHVVAGLPTKAIANQLRISTRTVENRRHQIHQKTQTNSLASLVAMVVELRLHADVI